MLLLLYAVTAKLLKDLDLLEVLNILGCIEANWTVMNENWCRRHE